ncbi:MAG: PD40 domain-containing protein, partial [Bacteroidia bacterium]|nr:PD40 domain-containing protein [Bacteroidia bacterium]
YFTSRRPGSTGNKTDAYAEYFEDIYESTLNGTTWSTPKNLGAPVNSENHDACSGLTAEGHTLLIYRPGKTFLTGDIYSCDFDGTKWSAPVALDKEVDSDKWQEPSACYSPDGNTLYFSSNRPGGFGGKDIYYVEKLPNGKWGKTLNLGPQINTPYDEDAPFIHPDGKRLFFSSTGHENMGGYDVFYSVIDSNLTFSKPVNMGYPLNTVDDDIYFVVTGNGNTGYISSDREGGLGEADIYKVNLHENDLVYDVHTGFARSDSGAPLDANLTLIESKTHKIAGVFKSNSLSGKFILLMAPDREYTVLCESDGFVSESIHMINKELDFEIKLKKK